MAALLYVVCALAALLLARRTGLLSWPAAAVILLLPLAFTGRALLAGRVYAPLDLAFQSEPLASMARQAGVTHVINPALSDVTAQFIPWNGALRWSLAHHQWPLWNPFELCGTVLAAAAQSAPYHPVTLVSLLLPAPNGLTFVAAMTYLLAALSAFLFFRTFCQGEIAALFGAAGWCFSQHVVAFMLTAHGATIALLPLVLFGAQRVIDDPRPRRCGALLLALTLATLCGHPETLMHIAALTVVYVLVMSRRDRLPALGWVAATGIAAILLCAMFLAPILEAIPQTREYRHRAGEASARRNGWAVVLHLLRNDVVPFAEGVPGIEMAPHPPAMRHHWAGTAYAGAILLPPALFAVWRRRSRITMFFAVLILFSLLAGAEAPVVSDVLLHLPLFNIAVNARMIAFATLGICALAAIGIEAMPALYLVVAAGIIVLAVTTAGLSADFLRVSAAHEVVPLLVAFIGLRLLPSRAAAPALLALLLLQRVVEAGGFVPTMDRAAFFPPIAGRELLRDGRVTALGTMFTPNTAAQYGLEDPRGYDAMNFAPLAETFPLWSVPQPVWSNRIDDLARPFLAALNVRYAFVPPQTRLSGWRTIAHFEAYDIVENEHVLPRAFVPAVVHAGARGDVIMAMLRCRDFGREAWIESNEPPATRAYGPGDVTARVDGSRLRLHARMAAPGWVVVSEPAWKGWRVTSEGRRLHTEFADHALIGFYLPQGEHDVVMTYRPVSFVAGAIVTITTAILLAFFTLRRTSPARP